MRSLLNLGVMADNDTPVFLVDGYSDPALLRIQGRASYLNCAPVSDFFKHMLAEGRNHVVVDFAGCTAMDSTFLGILAGAAMDFRKQKPPGKLTLVRLSERNLELVRNLGLHRILEVDAEGRSLNFDVDRAQTVATKVDGPAHASAESMLRAHEHLVEADKGNLKKFQDVLAYLRLQVEKDKEADEET